MFEEFNIIFYFICSLLVSDSGLGCLLFHWTWPSYINLNMNDSSSLKDIFPLLLNSFPCHPALFSPFFKPLLLPCKVHITHRMWNKLLLSATLFAGSHFYIVVSSWPREIEHGLEELFCTWNLLAGRKESETTNHLCSHSANSCTLNPTRFNRHRLDDVLNGSCISGDGERWSRCDLQLRKSLPYCWKRRWHTRGNITLSAFSISSISPRAYQSLARTGCWGEWLFDTTP